MAGVFVVRHTKRKANAVPMDQAFQKANNKPAKNNSWIVGISRRNDAVCRWNIIKNEKAWDCLNEYDEYVLDHDYSASTTVAD